MADSQACYGKLTRTQQDNMNKAAMELAQPPAPTGSAEVAPPTPRMERPRLYGSGLCWLGASN